MLCPKVTKVVSILISRYVRSIRFLGPTPCYNLTAYSGHYIAQCKHPFTQQWHEFNDSSVYSMNDKTRVISSNAYVLFYERNR